MLSYQLILCLFEALELYARTSHPLKKVRLEKSGSLFLGCGMQRIPWYGMEGKNRYGMAQASNGRFDLWNGTKSSIFHTNFILAHFGMVLLKSVVFSVDYISRQSLSSTRTVIHKLRTFFVISTTNSYVDTKKRSLILILFSWGQGTLSPDFCMFTSVLPACHCVRRDSYLASIVSNGARWLSPKPARSCHEKLLDPAKNYVTNFQLKSAKNSELLLKKLLFLRC